MKNDNNCGSCRAPLKNEDVLGTNSDGTKNKEYCSFCYQEGKWVHDVSMEEFMTLVLPRMPFPEPISRMLLKKGMPKLKRWATN